MRRFRVLLMTASLVVTLLVAGLLTASLTRQDELFQVLGNLAEVVHLVLAEYVEPLNEGAISQSLDAGIVEAVDPAAAVLTASAVDAYRQLVQVPPAYGLMFATRLSSAAVRQTLAGSPAATAGLQSWEVIEQVEGVYTRGRPLWQLRLQLRERESRGEPTRLSVVDRRVDQRREVVLEATPWQPLPAESRQHEGYTLLVVNSLPAGAAAALATPASAPPDIVDLRQLVWGLEGEAIATADLFVDEGVLGTWRGRRAGEQIFAAADGSSWTVPEIVLIGPDTEGVGEILAAALKRAGATLVGQRSSGRASRMQLVNDGDLHLYMPVANWLRADGTSITGNGLEPDEKVEPAEDAADDAVLARAVELLRARLSAAA